MGKAKPVADPNVIRFKCARCSTFLKVSVKAAGKYIDCAKCKQRTPVPSSQEEADEEAREYTVSATVEPVPEKCKHCGKKLKKGAIFCINCGYDYREGKFHESGLEKLEAVKVSGPTLGDRLSKIDFGKMTRVGLSAAVIVTVVGLVAGFVYFRRTGGFLNKALFDMLSQLYTEREVRDTFGAPRERILMAGGNLDGAFLSLDNPDEAARAKAAGLDPDRLRSQGFTYVADVEPKAKTILMVGQPGSDYFLFYANSNAAMIVCMKPGRKVDSESCNMAAFLQSNGDGTYTIAASGMAPSKNARGDVTGYSWANLCLDQVVMPDAPDPNLTFKPGACWKLWQKADLRSFRF